jgi:zinc transport system substrate-binding protein
MFTALWSGFAAGTGEKAGNDAERSTEKQGLSVFVSILPQKYFVERITGGHAEVSVMVPPGKSPATYDPSPRQVTSLGGADIFFTIGVPFERSFLPTVRDNLSGVDFVDTSEDIERHSIQSAIESVEADHAEADEAGDDHDHGHEHGHGLENPDPHIWLSPPLVVKQAQTMLEALVAHAPGLEESFRENFRAFVDDLQELDEELHRILEPVKGSPLLVYHPSFGYFAENYGLSQIPIELGGDEPTPKQLQKIISLAKRKGVKVIFVQPEFSTSSARRVAEAIDGAVVEVAPLKPNYLENMRNIAEEIRRGLAGE